MGLARHITKEWSNFIKGLGLCGQFLSNEEDMLLWSWNGDTRQIRTKLAYDTLFISNNNEDIQKW